jgi:hypothetical protein
MEVFPVRRFDAFKRPRPVKDNHRLDNGTTSKKEAVEPQPLPSDRDDVYERDGIVSIHNHDFTADPAFIAAYQRALHAVENDNKILYDIEWRLHVCLWTAAHAIRLQGSLVECGVNYGFQASAIMEYLDWNDRNVHFYLFDTWCGLDETLLTDEEVALGRKDESESMYSDCYAQARRNFADFKNVTLIRGSVPSTLDDVEIPSVSYLSLDMNCAEPEVQAARFFWPKLVPGGVVLLDDYAYKGYAPQKKAMDRFASDVGVAILSMPTGQGLIIKP